MKNRKSLREFQEASGEISYKVMRAAILGNEDLKPKEDYTDCGNDLYICLSAAMYLIGRFSLENYRGLEESIRFLSQDVKKPFVSNRDLPPLEDDEQSWNDQILPIIKGNAAFLHLEYNEFLHQIYQRMHFNYDLAKGQYLERIRMPDAKYVTKFRVVTCTKELRMKFERAMSKIMAEGRSTYGNNRG